MNNKGIQDIEALETDLLLEALYRRWGYDFRSYARASIDRRIRQFISGTDYSTVSEMIPRVIHDRAFFSNLVKYFSIPVTELFRDPFVYASVRKNVIPMVKTWPHFKVWHAGCATGEEVYSMAVLLQEEGVYDRATVYATDINADALDKARGGIYEIARIKEATQNYQSAGGRASFSEYYHARYNAVAMHPSLKERVVFSGHNLVSDSVFGEMHLVFCRNVLIYFNRELQNRALELFTESLVNGGFLCIGTREDLQFTSVADKYQVVDYKARIYKKKYLP